MISHEILVITGRGFQHIRSDQIKIQNSFDDISKGGGLNAGKFFVAEFTFVPESVSFSKSVEFVPDDD